MRVAAYVLSIVGAIGGFFLAFGAWGVGYCGALTPDVASPATLRDDLCRGTTGDIAGGVVVVCALLAAAAPIIGLWWSLRKGSGWPLAACFAAGATPIVTIAILAETLPQA